MIQTMPLPPLPPSAMTHPSSLLPPPIPAKPSQGLPGVPRGMPVFQQPPPPAPATAGAVVSAATTTEFTVVVYSFCDEEVPYRIKIPGSNPPTLRQFKEYLPKKGNYR